MFNINFSQALTGLKESFMDIPKNFKDAVSQLTTNPTAIIAIILLLVAILIIIKFGKIQFTPKLMAQVALSVAIAAVLNNIKFMQFPQGGSVTLASMLPIFLMAFAYGPQIGFLTGFIFGIVNFFMGPYIVSPVQVLFDYPLPFMLLGVAGYFPKHSTLGMILASILRYICHVISGVVFFASFAPEGMNPMIYSLSYNAPIVFIELVIILVIAFVLNLNRLVKGINKKAPEIKL